MSEVAAQKTAVLLLAHGSPDAVEEIPEYLRNVTGGRPLPPEVIAEIQHRYGLIGRSPLTELTLRQARALERELSMPVYVGMRNWKPWIADTVARMHADGVMRCVAICLAPQNSRTSTGKYREALLAQKPFSQLEFIASWHDHPQLTAAFAEKLKDGWQRASAEAGKKVPVILTAHSVPERTITDGDPYEQQSRETGALVAAQVEGLTPDLWRFAFQSQGQSGGKWIGPTVEEVILEFKAAGRKNVFIQPVGFVCDHVEVLYDIDIAFRQFAAEQGMTLTRAESLNDSPLLIAALADLVRSRLI